MAKISVIVPCYNGEKYIARCLDSLLAQTFQDIEIIVVNDGSSDNSQDIIEDYQKRYPEKIKAVHQSNKGIATTRNTGLKYVTGDYIGFLDCDDYTTLDMFEKMYQKAIDTNADMVVSNFLWETEKGHRLEKEGPYQGGLDMIVNLFATLWNKIYKREVIEQIQIQFPDNNRYEDAYFLYCIAPYMKNIAFIDESFVRYVQVGNSITHTNNEHVKNMITVFEKIVQFYQERNLWDTYKEALCYIHIKFFLGNSFLRSCRIKDKKDRKETILMGYDLLVNNFPNWHQNQYLRQKKDLKHLYFRCISRWNILLISELFHILLK